jgi:hypothetical protein
MMLHQPEGVLARFGQDADAVHHRIRAMDRGAHAVVVADIGENRLHLADRAIGRTNIASFGRRTATRTRQPSLAMRRAM